jgi:hypothetical protein
MRMLFPPRLQMEIMARLERSRGPDLLQQAPESEPSENQKTASHRPRINTSLGLAPSVLPASDVARALRRYRYETHFRGERRVPIRTLAGIVGLSHETLYDAMRGGNASEPTLAKLSWAIIAIGEGRLGFRRRRQAWEPWLASKSALTD